MVKRSLFNLILCYQNTNPYKMHWSCRTLIHLIRRQKKYGFIWSFNVKYILIEYKQILGWEWRCLISQPLHRGEFSIAIKWEVVKNQLLDSINALPHRTSACSLVNIFWMFAVYAMFVYLLLLSSFSILYCFLDHSSTY